MLVWIKNLLTSLLTCGCEAKPTNANRQVNSCDDFQGQNSHFANWQTSYYRKEENDCMIHKVEQTYVRASIRSHIDLS